MKALIQSICAAIFIAVATLTFSTNSALAQLPQSPAYYQNKIELVPYLGRDAVKFTFLQPANQAWIPIYTADLQSWEYLTTQSPRYLGGEIGTYQQIYYFDRTGLSKHFFWGVRTNQTTITTATTKAATTITTSSSKAVTKKLKR